MSYAKGQTRSPGQPTGRAGGFAGIIGSSPALKQALKQVDALLRSGAPAMVLEGETGTGKTVLARAIHDRKGTPRRPFLLFPSSALPSHLLEAQLFGSSMGSPGLLALAARGTLVLEDADALPPELQDGLAELLPSAGRWIAPEDEDLPLLILTTRRAPPNELDSVPFEPPLAELVRPSRVVIPPLRKREGDVERLTRHFLATIASQGGNGPFELDRGVLEALERQPWPGNVRELNDTLQRAATLAPGSTIRVEHLRIRTRATRPVNGAEASVSEMIVVPPEGKTLEQIEAEAVKATLEITQGNRSQAARILGVSRPTLARKIRKYHLNGSR